MKMSGLVAHACNPSGGEAKTRFLGSLSSQDRLLSELQANERHCGGGGQPS